MSPKILYIQYTNPAGCPPLEHSSRILADKGWKVLFLGTGAFGAANDMSFPSHPNIILRKLFFCPAGWLQKLHYIWFCIWVMLWTFYWRSQWAYASGPLSCPSALILSYFSNIRIIYHEHDSPNLEQNGGRHISNFVKFIMWTRHRLARRAQLCVLPNEKRTGNFKINIGKDLKALTVWNCPIHEEVSFPRKANTDGKLWLLYHGNISPSRLPLTLLEALKMFPNQIYLRVIGYEPIGSLGYTEILRETAENLGLKQQVDFIGTVPTRKELLRYCRELNIGLAVIPKRSYDINDRMMAGASNKPFDYLASGLALLVSDLPDWKRMYVEPGYGLACNPEDPESIATCFRWFLEHPAEMRKMGELGRQRILAEWNYEKQFTPVIGILNNGVNKR